MSTLISLLTSAAEKRAAYQRTMSELESMNDAMVFDLGLHRYEFEALAHKSVYGN